LIEYIDVEEYSETAQSIIYDVKSDMDAYMKYSRKNNAIGELNNYLTKLTAMSIKDSGKISNVKRMIVRNILTKYYDDTKHTYSKFLNVDKNTKSDLALVLR